MAQFFPRMCVYNDVEGWQNMQFWGRGEFTLPFGNYEVNITTPSDHVLEATGDLLNRKDVFSAEQLKRYELATKTFDKPIVVVTAEDTNILFVAAERGTAFDTPVVTNVSDDLDGTVLSEILTSTYEDYATFKSECGDFFVNPPAVVIRPGIEYPEIDIVINTDTVTFSAINKTRYADFLELGITVMAIGLGEIQQDAYSGDEISVTLTENVDSAHVIFKSMAIGD
jgi:hypothetical protein